VEGTQSSGASLETLSKNILSFRKTIYTSMDGHPKIENAAPVA
jgi:hypothetical protein